MTRQLYTEPVISAYLELTAPKPSALAVPAPLRPPPLLPATGSPRKAAPLPPPPAPSPRRLPRRAGPGAAPTHPPRPGTTRRPGAITQQRPAPLFRQLLGDTCGACASRRAGERAGRWGRRRAGRGRRRAGRGRAGPA